MSPTAAGKSCSSVGVIRVVTLATTSPTPGTPAAAMLDARSRTSGASDRHAVPSHSWITPDWGGVVANEPASTTRMLSRTGSYVATRPAAAFGRLGGLVEYQLTPSHSHISTPSTPNVASTVRCRCGYHTSRACPVCGGNVALRSDHAVPFHSHVS